MHEIKQEVAVLSERLKNVPTFSWLITILGSAGAIIVIACWGVSKSYAADTKAEVVAVRKETADHRANTATEIRELKTDMRLWASAQERKIDALYDVVVARKNASDVRAASLRDGGR